MKNIRMVGGVYHFRKRVPRRFASVAPMGHEFCKSLETSDPVLAAGRAAVYWDQAQRELELLLTARGAAGAKAKFDALAGIAKMNGFDYRSAGQLADGDLGNIVQRIELLGASKAAPQSDTAAALLGAVEAPRETLSEVAERMAKISPLDLKDKNQKQRRVWLDRWKRPAKKVKEILGRDPVMIELDRIADCLPFRDALVDQILEGDLKGASAQKDLQNLSLMWNKYHESLGLDSTQIPASPWRELGKQMSKMDEEGHRAEVPEEFLLKMIAPGAMAGMNDELRDITLVLIETGCRQSEVTDISPDNIILDHGVPHLMLKRQEGEFARILKNPQSARSVPLVGVALEAMLRNPQGFPRYRGTGTYSAAANKSLHSHGLLPEGVTIGSTRHSFDKRLDRANVRNEHVAQLMGHGRKAARGGRPVYGDDLTLNERKAYHELIMLRRPSV